jgi:CcmD family protein
MNRFQSAWPGLLALVLSTVALSPLVAQAPETGMAGQSLRPYWHVFIAYAIAIALVLGWVISIGRRLKDVEERLGQ